MTQQLTCPQRFHVAVKADGHGVDGTLTDDEFVIRTPQETLQAFQDLGRDWAGEFILGDGTAATSVSYPAGTSRLLTIALKPQWPEAGRARLWAAERFVVREHGGVDHEYLSAIFSGVDNIDNPCYVEHGRIEEAMKRIWIAATIEVSEMLQVNYDPV